MYHYSYNARRDMIRIPGDRDDGAQELYVGTIYKANSLQ
jgi:hypothetical protein